MIQHLLGIIQGNKNLKFYISTTNISIESVILHALVLYFFYFCTEKWNFCFIHNIISFFDSIEVTPRNILLFFRNVLIFSPL